MSDIVALAVPLVVVAAAAVGAAYWARRRTPPSRGAGAHRTMTLVYAAIAVAAVLLFVPLAIAAWPRG
jgi:uncharacterized membrane protein YidH (DUF202 family)